MMTNLACVLFGLFLGFMAGFLIRDLDDRIRTLETAHKSHEEVEGKEEPKSTLVDPLDPQWQIEQAKREHEEAMKKLNG